jgi:hypothetical protein
MCRFRLELTNGEPADPPTCLSSTTPEDRVSCRGRLRGVAWLVPGELTEKNTHCASAVRHA